MADTFTATALQEEALDALCWRVLGETDGVVERALELNRGLADRGVLLAEGQTVILPVLGDPYTPEREIVKLWD